MGNQIEQVALYLALMEHTMHQNQIMIREQEVVLQVNVQLHLVIMDFLVVKDVYVFN